MRMSWNPEDPIDPEEIDRRLRIQALTDELAERGLREPTVHPDCPSAAHEASLRNMAAFDTAPLTSHFEQLEASGVDLPAPDSLTEEQVTAKLWEVIHALAAMDTFLYRTDHLSDRGLYEGLWGDTLREVVPTMPRGSGWVWQLDMLGSGSQEDIENSLRYYDSDEERAWWARDFPDDVIPPRERRPFDRDRFLPKDGEADRASDSEAGGAAEDVS